MMMQNDIVPGIVELTKNFEGKKPFLFCVLFTLFSFTIQCERLWQPH